MTTLTLMLARRKFLQIVLATGVMLGGVNYLVHRAAGNSMPRQVLRRLTNPARAEVIALGNSLVQAGFDTSAFVEGWGRHGESTTAVNGGLGASGPVPHLLLGLAALKSHPEARVLVYGFFDFNLTEPPREPWWRAFGNEALIFQTEPGIAARHLAEGSMERAAFRVLAKAPMFVERGTFWARVESWRREMGGIGLPGNAVNRFGRVRDFAELTSTNEEQFLAKAAEQERLPLAPALAELFAHARENGVAVRLILMPMPESHRARYRTSAWRRYLEKIQMESAPLGGVVIDASDWVVGEGMFMDSLHLSSAGAREFSVRLGLELGVEGN